jgi:hypothetical protein
MYPSLVLAHEDPLVQDQVKVGLAANWHVMRAIQ